MTKTASLAAQLAAASAALEAKVATGDATDSDFDAVATIVDEATDLGLDDAVFAAAFGAK